MVNFKKQSIENKTFLWSECLCIFGSYNIVILENIFIICALSVMSKQNMICNLAWVKLILYVLKDPWHVVFNISVHSWESNTTIVGAKRNYSSEKHRADGSSPGDYRSTRITGARVFSCLRFNIIIIARQYKRMLQT